MASWTLDDIAWDEFDRRRLDPEIVKIVKPAALVEYNGEVYADYLCRLFHDDPAFRARARCWGKEETRHGEALAHWAAIADPDWDFGAAFACFRAGYQPDFGRDVSRRGSRAGEMVARCIVETGTSTFYSALRDITQEPVLKEICHRIAADEVRHYKFFYRTLIGYLDSDPIGFWRRLRVAFGRLAEADDDELAYAYYAANGIAGPYDRRRCANAYARRAFALYREAHVARGVKMIFRAGGLAANGRFSRAAARLAWAAMKRRVAYLARAAEPPSISA